MRTPELFAKIIPINAPAGVWLAVLSQIDLAGRHPQNNGAVSKIAESFADQLRDRMLEEGMLTKEEYAECLRAQVPYRKNPNVGPPR